MTNQTTSEPKTQEKSRKSTGFNYGRVFLNIFGAAFLAATLFTMWTPSKLFSNPVLNQALLTMQPQEAGAQSASTPTPSQMPHIGIVAGHWGNDSGSVCDDGLTERDVNLRIATLVKNDLIKEGYEVDLLQEFDDKLNSYEALALVSIHSDSCQYINDTSTGFKVAPAISLPNKEKSNRLASCMTDRYSNATGLEFHFNTITDDMTYYHAFDEINSSTPAIIIEVGFLNLDRDILTNHPDVVAQGITQGILCYVRNESITNSGNQTEP